MSDSPAAVSGNAVRASEHKRVDVDCPRCWPARTVELKWWARLSPTHRGESGSQVALAGLPNQKPDLGTNALQTRSIPHRPRLEPWVPRVRRLGGARRRGRNQCLEMPGRTLFEVRDELSAVAQPVTRPVPPHLALSCAVPSAFGDVAARPDAILLKINTLDARADSRDRTGTRPPHKDGLNAGEHQRR
jgi:hypothetical protein